MLAQSRPIQTASSSRAAACSHRRSVLCLAKHHDGVNAAQRCATAMLSAAVAASLLVAPAPMAVAAAREPEQKSFGAGRTSKLIESGGTPGAVRPDSMKTNVPFQAPGINAPPRGKAQEEGSSPVQVFKNVKKQNKENYHDPDSAPFGISKGPLVREAKKMPQPGNVGNANKEGARRFKKMSADTRAAQAVQKDPSKPQKRGIINGSFTTIFGGRNQ